MTAKPDLQIELTLAETRTIAKDAYIYGFPMVQAYLTMYAFSIDTHNPQYKGPFNAPSVLPVSSRPTIVLSSPPTPIRPTLS